MNRSSGKNMSVKSGTNSSASSSGSSSMTKHPYDLREEINGKVN